LSGELAWHILSLLEGSVHLCFEDSKKKNNKTGIVTTQIRRFHAEFILETLLEMPLMRLHEGDAAYYDDLKKNTSWVRITRTRSEELPYLLFCTCDVVNHIS